MDTRVIQLEPGNAKSTALYRDVARLLSEGRLVALPTETVYGLAADALNEAAVAEIFAVKDRPRFDPLICHLPDARSIETIAEIPADVHGLVNKLAENFWPGPMTLILPRKSCVPDIVTSGLPTVACRVPQHEVMRGVAGALGHPIAAPSANRFGHISPTSAAAVQKELGGRIPLIVDAGACSEGLESTILRPCLDEKGKPAVEILRQGPVTVEQIRTVCRVLKPVREAQKNPVAPGQLPSHYAPAKPLSLHDPKKLFTPQPGVRYGLISYRGDSPLAKQENWQNITALSPGSGRLAEAAVRLFAVMRAMDEREDIDRIIAEELPETGLGRAMMDRLRRAAAANTLPD